jgi:hypothetical protein
VIAFSSPGGGWPPGRSIDIYSREDSMRPAQSNATDAPFSLVCRDCDAGMNITSHDHAVAEGWTEIDYAPELPMANFVGLCPECLEHFGRWPSGDDAEFN